MWAVEDVDVCLPLQSSNAVPYIRSRYYVYALFKKEDVNPFYIGKGINNRINQHFMESSLKRETNRKSKTIRKHAATIRREILCYFDTESAAFDFEEYLISYYKLVGDGGCLFNVAKSRHDFPEASKKAISEKKTSRQIVYSEEDVLTLYRNYFEKRQTLRECVQGTKIPRRYSSAIARGERFKGLYRKYVESGLVNNLRQPEDDLIRKDPENQKVSDEEIIEIFDLVCSQKFTLKEVCEERYYSAIWLGKVFIGLDRKYLKLDYDLYRSLPKGRHVARERAYLLFKEHYPEKTTNPAELVGLVGRSKSVINRYILRYKQEKEASDGS